MILVTGATGFVGRHVTVASERGVIAERLVAAFLRRYARGETVPCPAS